MSESDGSSSDGSNVSIVKKLPLKRQKLFKRISTFEPEISESLFKSVDDSGKAVVENLKKKPILFKRNSSFQPEFSDSLFNKEASEGNICTSTPFRKNGTLEDNEGIEISPIPLPPVNNSGTTPSQRSKFKRCFTHEFSQNNQESPKSSNTSNYTSMSRVLRQSSKELSVSVRIPNLRQNDSMVKTINEQSKRNTNESVRCDVSASQSKQKTRTARGEKRSLTAENTTQVKNKRIKTKAVCTCFNEMVSVSTSTTDLSTFLPEKAEKGTRTEKCDSSVTNKLNSLSVCRARNVNQKSLEREKLRKGMSQLENNYTNSLSECDVTVDLDINKPKECELVHVNDREAKDDAHINVDVLVKENFRKNLEGSSNKKGKSTDSSKLDEENTNDKSRAAGSDQVLANKNSRKCLEKSYSKKGRTSINTSKLNECVDVQVNEERIIDDVSRFGRNEEVLLTESHRKSLEKSNSKKGNTSIDSSNLVQCAGMHVITKGSNDNLRTSGANDEVFTKADSQKGLENASNEKGKNSVDLNKLVECENVQVDERVVNDMTGPGGNDNILVHESLVKSSGKKGKTSIDSRIHTNDKVLTKKNSRRSLENSNSKKANTSIDSCKRVECGEVQIDEEETINDENGQVVAKEISLESLEGSGKISINADVHVNAEAINNDSFGTSDEILVSQIFRKSLEHPNKKRNRSIDLSNRIECGDMQVADERMNDVTRTYRKNSEVLNKENSCKTMEKSINIKEKTSVPSKKIVTSADVHVTGEKETKGLTPKSDSNKKKTSVKSSRRETLKTSSYKNGKKSVQFENDETCGVRRSTRVRKPVNLPHICVVMTSDARLVRELNNCKESIGKRKKHSKRQGKGRQLSNNNDTASTSRTNTSKTVVFTENMNGSSFSPGFIETEDTNRRANEILSDSQSTKISSENKAETSTSREVVAYNRHVSFKTTPDGVINTTETSEVPETSRRMPTRQSVGQSFKNALSDRLINTTERNEAHEGSRRRSERQRAWQSFKNASSDELINTTETSEAPERNRRRSKRQSAIDSYKNTKDETAEINKASENNRRKSTRQSDQPSINPPKLMTVKQHRDLAIGIASDNEEDVKRGLLEVKIGGEKPSSYSKEHNIVYFVTQGVAFVCINNDKKFKVLKGGDFVVKKGFNYSIKNASINERLLLYFAKYRSI